MDDVVEEIPARAVFDLDNPQVWIESNFLNKPRFDFGLRRRRRATDERREYAVGGPRLVECGLRSRSIESAGPIETIDLDKDSAGLIRAPAPDRRENTLNVATPQKGRNPYTGLQSHQLQ